MTSVGNRGANFNDSEVIVAKLPQPTAEETPKPDKDSGGDFPRYDVAVVAQNSSFTVVEQGTRSILTFLAGAQVILPYEESIAEGWTEVYCKPGACAHEAFVIGQFNEDEPPFLEFVVRTGTTNVAIWPEQEGSLERKFYLEFRGALWSDLTGQFKSRLQKAIYTRITTTHRTFESLPAHREVSDAEKPKTPAKKQGNYMSHRVGTAVEEF